MVKKMRRRNDIDICADILTIARTGVRKTRIVYGANLNFKITKKYLKRLEDNKLIQAINGKFYTTDRGTGFLHQYKTLETII